MNNTYTIITSDTASDLVRRVLQNLCNNPEVTTVGPRGMATRELRWCHYELTDVTRCATWLPGRGLNYPFMFAEFLWMFSGRDDLEMIKYYNEAIAKFSDDGLLLYGAYGPRWRMQVNGAIERLRKDGDTRQAVICTWRPDYQWENTDDDGDYYRASKDVPCTLTMQYLLREGKLECGVVMRSSDAWLGLPYDIFCFSMLQRAIAAEIGVYPGPLSLFIGSSHLYDRDLEKARTVLDYVRRTVGNRDVFIPGPASIALDHVMLAECLIREGEFISDPHAIPDGWGPLLSMLEYRRHRDWRRVHPTINALVEPSVPPVRP